MLAYSSPTSIGLPMLDPQLFRNNIEETATKLRRRGFVLDVDKFRDLEVRRKEIQVKTQELQNKRNTISKLIGQAKARGENIENLLIDAQDVNDQLNDIEVNFSLHDELLNIPNILDYDVPDGANENDNVEIYKWGNIPKFAFKAKDHVDLGLELGYLDFETATKISGSRFVVLTGPLAQLQRAIAQFMLNHHTIKNGYTETYVPFIVNSESLKGTGQLPKFEEDLFKIDNNQGLYLAPTAEVPVTNIVRNQIIDAENLPLKFVCQTPCFRSEAGSYGRDVRGMIRQHQFEKVELVQITTPDQSQDAHKELTTDAESILIHLGLPYRKVLLCAGDTGFASKKTYDLEVWLPGQENYREISSCSNFGDFQARRLQARWKNPTTGKNEYVHTINGSGLAVGRTLVAIMENFQTEYGTIKIPEVLIPYMNGLTEIKRKNVV